MCPVSPRQISVTLPLGRIQSQVMLPCFKDIRNHASGGNCKALKKRKEMIRKKHIKYFIIMKILLHHNIKEQILPANKISDDICMAYENSISILFLTRICTIKVLSKCCFYSRPILKKLEYH